MWKWLEELVCDKCTKQNTEIKTNNNSGNRDLFGKIYIFNDGYYEWKYWIDKDGNHCYQLNGKSRDGYSIYIVNPIDIKSRRDNYSVFRELNDMYRAEMKDKTFYCAPIVYPEDMSFLSYDPDILRKIAKRRREIEQIKQSKQMETKSRILKWQNAQRIIAVACDSWKSVLIDSWSKNIALTKNINVPESDYQDMRKACTKEQHQLFDEIFGKDVKILPKGTWALVSDNKQNWNPRCSNGNNEFYESGNTAGSTCIWKYTIPITEELAQEILNTK